MIQSELIPYAYPETVEIVSNRIENGHPLANSGAYGQADALNSVKGWDCYGHGDCVTFRQMHPGSPYLPLGEVAIGDDKGEAFGDDNRILPVTIVMARKLVAYVSRPDAVIPGMDTTSELDYFHGLDPSDDTEWALLKAKAEELGISRSEYDIEVAGEAAGTFLDPIRTGDKEEDCIELGAVHPDSRVRLVGCTAMWDSRFPTSTALVFDHREMRQFIAGARRGDFDDPGAPASHPNARPSYVDISSGTSQLRNYATLQPGVDYRLPQNANKLTDKVWGAPAWIS
jgi:hypothetical protein